MAQSCPSSLARVQPIRASRPRTVDTSRPSRALRPTEPRAHPSRAKRISKPRPHEPPRRAPVQAVVTDRRAAGPTCALGRADARALSRAHTRALGRANARHAHSAVHTPEHSAVHTPDTSTRPHSLAQVTLDLLCSTLSYMKIMFCFYLYTSRLSAGLIMWDNSQFMFFFIFSSTFILT